MRTIKYSLWLVKLIPKINRMRKRIHTIFKKIVPLPLENLGHCYCAVTPICIHRAIGRPAVDESLIPSYGAI
jgi:hypothetical protein